MNQSRNKREGWPAGKSNYKWDRVPGQRSPNGTLVFKLAKAVGKFSRTKEPMQMLKYRKESQIDWS